MTRASTQIHRQTHIDGTSNQPGWWTPARRAVMEALLVRSEIKGRMASHAPGTAKTPRWRPHATGMKTRHLFDTTDTVLNSRNVGPAIRNLIDWGYIFKLSTTVSKVMFTPKGWAWLAAEGLIEPAWLELIYDRPAQEGYESNRDVAWKLYRKMRDSRKLAAAAQLPDGFVEKTVADIMEPSPMTENLPFVEKPTEDELPGLPQFSPDMEEAISFRANNGDEVIRQRQQLARDFKHQTVGKLSTMHPKEIDGALSRHFSSEEIIRADFEMIRDQRKGPRESYYSRQLIERMSEAGEFQPRTLADHAEQSGLDVGQGAERIAAAASIQHLHEEGLARHMPKTATLGEVHDRLLGESVVYRGQEDDHPVIPDARTIFDNGKLYGRDEAIADVISHGEDFRTALTKMRDTVPPSDDETDDVGYWQHQLNVLDRILLALDIAAEPTPEPGSIDEADDKTPTVDWIENQIAQRECDNGVVRSKDAALVARAAVLRHMRQNPAGARVVMSEGEPFTQYDGFRLHVRHKDASTFNGRPCQFIMTVESDYDPEDVQAIETWFSDFIGYGAAGMKGELTTRSYHYPAGSRVKHERVGDVENVEVTPTSDDTISKHELESVQSLNPLWMIGMSIGSAFLALVMFLLVLRFIPMGEV